MAHSFHNVMVGSGSKVYLLVFTMTLCVYPAFTPCPPIKIGGAYVNY